MLTQRFTIWGTLPGLNEMLGAANAHRMIGAQLKKKSTESVAWCAKANNLKTVKSTCSVVIRWYEKNARRDLDNVAAGVKYILDGLVQAGVLPNDGRAWVSGISHEFPEPDKQQPRIEVEIREEAS